MKLGSQKITLDHSEEISLDKDEPERKSFEKWMRKGILREMFVEEITLREM